MPSTATRSRPIHPRRVSGPVRRPATAGPQLRGRTSAFERIARIPDNRIVDRILRSRGVIWLIGIMLGGIVAMQVSLLKLNTGISRAYTTQETLAGQNAMLQTQITDLSAAASTRTKAADLNLVDPAAGDTRFLTSRGVEKDATRAVKRIKPPSEQAKMVMFNDGFMPGVGATMASLMAAKQGTTAPLTEVQPTPTPVGPTATVEPLPTPVPTAPPVTSATPMATPTVDPATGLAAAPQG